MGMGLSGGIPPVPNHVQHNVGLKRLAVLRGNLEDFPHLSLLLSVVPLLHPAVPKLKRRLAYIERVRTDPQ